jgi:hypothetical protein
MSPQTKSGYLIVRASTASGAIPVEGVTVIVQGKDEENSNVFLSLITDRDGLTPKITLPTVSRDESLSPSVNIKPYSLYNIEVYKDGYYPQHYAGVAIFEGITAVQNARIIPLSEFEPNSPHGRGEQVFDSYENPNL